MTNRDTRETRDVLKAMERKANSPKKAEIQKKRFEEASTAMQRLTLTAGRKGQLVPVRPIDWTGTFFLALTLRRCFTHYFALI